MNLNDFDPKWIQKGIEEETVAFAAAFGEYLCNLQPDYRGDIKPGKLALTSSQIRNVFGEVKRIQAKGYSTERSSFLLLRPKIAYAEARVLAKNSDSRIKAFRTVIEKAHLAVLDDQHFQNFVDFLEATLAYHKAAGGRDT